MCADSARMSPSDETARDGSIEGGEFEPFARVALARVGVRGGCLR